jgi:hypothetical protein
LTDTDFGGEMDHAFDTFQSAGDNRWIADIPTQELRLRGKTFGVLAVAVDLLDQTIEHPHLIAALKKLFSNGAADEPCATGHQYCLWQSSTPLRIKLLLFPEQ